MPHVARYFSQRAYDDSFEPCLKKSKPDHSASWGKKSVNPSEPEEQSNALSEHNKNESNKSNSIRPGVIDHFLSGSDYVPLSGTSEHCAQDVPCIKKRDSNINQHKSTLPKTEKQNSKNDSEFSETSTAFIGPLYQPQPQVKSLSKNSSNTANKPSSYKITTVEQGNSAGRSNGKDEMDYEMGQFYKELFELETTSDDQNIRPTTAEDWQCSNAPAVNANKHSETSAPQPCSTSQPCRPANPSVLMPLGSHLSEDQVSPAKYPSLPSTNNNICKGLATPKETPPPGLQGPISSSVLHYGPPLPKYDHPLHFPQEKTMPYPSFPENAKCHIANNDHLRPSTQSTLQTSSKSWFSLQGQLHTKLPANPFQQEYHRGDIGSHRSEDPDKNPPLSHNNQDTCNRLEPLKESPPLVSQTVPHADFRSSSSSFLRCSGPPPQRYDHSRHFPKENGNMLYLPFPENNKYSIVNDDRYKSRTQPSYQSSPAMSESRFSPQGRSHAKSFLEPLSNFSEQENQYRNIDSYLNQDPVLLAKHPPLPHNNQDTCNWPHRETTPFVTQSLPLPGFKNSTSPSFVPRCGPLPPRYDHPLHSQQEKNTLHSPSLENDKYDLANNDHYRPRTQLSGHNSAFSGGRYSPVSGSHHGTFLKLPANSSQQEYHQVDTGGWRDRHFGESSSPKAANNHHEVNTHRFRESPPVTQSARKLVLLRGVPGSGKSTLARTLLGQSPKGIVLSTDDYFCQENGYSYDVTLLGDAHSWNQNRAKKAMDDGMSPIIIDNTNIQSWEMKPYVHMAVDRGYDVEFLEPNTWWKLDPNELEKRNTHRVPREKISQMLERYEPNMTVGAVMNSVEPRRVRSRPPPEGRPRWGASVDCSENSKSFHSR